MTYINPNGVRVAKISLEYEYMSKPVIFSDLSAAVTTNKNIKRVPLRAVDTLQRKRVDQIDLFRIIISVQ